MTPQSVGAWRYGAAAPPRAGFGGSGRVEDLAELGQLRAQPAADLLA